MSLSPLNIADYRDIVRRALDEDLGGAMDITTESTVLATARARGRFVAKADCVLAGLDVAFECFRALEPDVQTTVRKADGERCRDGEVVAEISGTARTLLVGERTALNFLQRLSGIATLTNRFVAAARGRITVLDTRKTTPMLRALEKYAVRAGGATNHRIGLFDAVLIKDNHIALAGGVAAAVEKVRTDHPGTMIEIEADTLEQVAQAIAAGADTILLDNMTTDDIRKAVALSAGEAKFEISGGVTLGRMPDSRPPARTSSQSVRLHIRLPPSTSALTLNQSAEPLPRELADAIADVRPRLGRLGTSFEFFSTVGSTNDVASERASSGDHEGAVFVADAQTSGRGRRGRTWFSPPQAGLYVSTILAPLRSRDRERATQLTTLAAGVALVEGIKAATGLAAALKWPNDLYVARRKLAGILAESAGAAVVLGYGINVSPASYPPELGDRATSLETELGRSVDRPRVFAETLAALASRYQDLLDGRFDAILDAWRALAPAGQGARVSWTTPAGEQSGVTAGIDDRGALLVRSGDRIERIVAGELIWF